MIEVLAGWIIIQLIVIGIVGVDKENKIINGTYQCTREGKTPVWFGAIFPLICFVPESSEEKEYCENKISANKKKEKNYE